MLHTDSYENMHCLVSGRKEFVLIEPQYSTVIGPEHSALGYYHIDVDRLVDFMCIHTHTLSPTFNPQTPESGSLPAHTKYI